jgi:hypothetical protein
LIEELFQQFNVDEHGRSVSQLIGYDIQKRFRAKDIVFGASTTTLGPKGS